MLLAVAALLTAGLLLARYRLDSVRDQAVEAISRQIGAHVTLDSAALAGPNTISVTALAFRVGSPDRVEASITAPKATVTFELAHLLRGDFQLAALTLDRPTVDIQVRQTGELLASGLPEGAGRFPLPPGVAIRGSDASIHATSPFAPPVSFLNATFSTRKDPLGELTGSLAGDLHVADQDAVPARFRFTANGSGRFDSDLRIDGASLPGLLSSATTRELPIRAGEFDPRFRLTLEDREWRFACDAQVRGLVIEGAPAFLQPLNGFVQMESAIDPDDRSVMLRRATVDFGVVRGEVHGLVDFSTASPLLNIRLESDHLPINTVLDELTSAIESRTQDRTLIHAALSGPSQLLVNVSGPAATPHIVVRANAGAGLLEVESQDETLPDAALQFGLLEIIWDNKSSKPQATLTVTDGTVSHNATDLLAERVSGSLRLDHPRLLFDPLTADIRGNRFAGYVELDVESRTGTLDLRGKLTRLEQTPLADAIRYTELAGAANMELRASVDEGGTRFAGEVDATDAEILHRTWFLKPYGLGVRAAFDGRVLEDGAVELDARVTASGSAGQVQLLFAPGAGRLDLKRCTASIEVLDAVTVGRTLRIPYRVSGGSVVAGEYVWLRDDGVRPDGTRFWHGEGWAEFDALTVRAEGAEHAIRASGLRVDYALRNAETNTGDVRLHAEQATMPPFGTKWFGSPDIPPALRERYPAQPRDFTFHLAAGAVEAPPWDGANFEGTAFLNDAATGLESYRAAIGEGHIEGSFRKDRVHNASENLARWERIPVTYLTRHLGQPEILNGLCTGHVQYSRDADDPRSLQGTGAFEVEDGQFSADYLLYEMGVLSPGDAASLPPSLRFARLQSEVAFQQDVIETPTLLLESEGIRIEARGRYMIGGDLDYAVDVTLSPEVARQIPALQEHLNLEGHTLAQQDIRLAFQLSGAATSPRSEVTQATPVSVTLVAGGLEVMSEAAKVIDIPRKVLGDLLKIGGGLVGVKRRTE